MEKLSQINLLFLVYQGPCAACWLIIFLWVAAVKRQGKQFYVEAAEQLC